MNLFLAEQTVGAADGFPISLSRQTTRRVLTRFVMETVSTSSKSYQPVGYIVR